MSRAAHLDALGGIAGDMMLAALIDADPALAPVVETAAPAAGLPAGYDLSIETGRSLGFAGKRFRVMPPQDSPPTPSGTYGEIRDRLATADLPPGTESRAQDIYRRLAEAEAEVHGTEIDRVHFHEIADWDSLADIVGVAAALDALGVDDWTVSDLPMGGGTVRTRHGPVPVPAPATAKLLQGFKLVDDGIGGERVTPTGAAILAHLQARQGSRVGGRLSLTGTGLGTKDLGSTANLLRVTVYETDESTAETTRAWHRSEVVVISFEIDDQTAEDLAVGLDNIRRVDGVLDVAQTAVTAKKGRLATSIRVLAKPEVRDPVIDVCFRETTTIGLRWQGESRAELRRDSVERDGVRVKRVTRPGGDVTEKADMDDLGTGDRSTRVTRRQQAEQAQ